MSEAQLARWRTRNVGFIFQFYHLLPVLTAYENVELPLLLLNMSRAQRRKQVLTALDLVGLSNRLAHRPGQLSGGQQQRVGIARAIVTDPLLIVADEPTGDLDSKSAEEILDLMEELRQGLHKTILLVTHDPRAARRTQRLLFLDKGQLITTVPAGYQLGSGPHRPVPAHLAPTEHGIQKADGSENGIQRAAESTAIRAAEGSLPVSM
jgi:putative ABC transport system ATP-binding protein